VWEKKPKTLSEFGSAVDILRDEIEHLTEPVHDNRWRIRLKSQAELWHEGVRAGTALKNSRPNDLMEVEDEDDSPETQRSFETHVRVDGYVAGKWGRYLRAPDLYFEIIDRLGDQFIPLGSIVEIQRGITTGCDAFFMPHDVTAEILQKKLSDKEFRQLVGASRHEVEGGSVQIIKDGAGTVHKSSTKLFPP
jgi:hypothetical protein